MRKRIHPGAHHCKMMREYVNKFARAPPGCILTAMSSSDLILDVFFNCSLRHPPGTYRIVASARKLSPPNLFPEPAADSTGN